MWKRNNNVMWKKEEQRNEKKNNYVMWKREDQRNVEIGRSN